MKRGRALALLAPVALSLASVLAAPAVDARPSRGGPGARPGIGTANPSALVAAEIAFARLAAEKGQWTAFRKTADEHAVMFVPQVVRAQDWLRGRPDPAKPVAWQPHQVWMSCDGTLGVTRGAAQYADGAVGYYVTAWKRQKDGSYRWIMDQGDRLATALEAPEFLEAHVADCAPAALAVSPPVPGTPAPSGLSADRTLQWRVEVAQDGSRVTTVFLQKGGRLEPVLDLRVSAGG